MPTARTLRRSSSARVLLGAFLASALAGAAQADDLCGRWTGTWKSCTDQFQGTVNAKITRIDATHYKAVFTGRAFKIMPYRYTSILTVCRDEATGKTRFKASQKLPIWGCYWVNGAADGCTFFARYRTDDHTGYFRMQRVSR
jgi:hypothetical protein